MTMLQRTPSYVLPLPSEDAVALRLRRLFGDRIGHALARSKNIAMQRVLWLFARGMPRLTRRFIRSVVARELPAAYPVDVHFDPPYNPWDQRLCFDPGRRVLPRHPHAAQADAVMDPASRASLPRGQSRSPQAATSTPTWSSPQPACAFCRSAASALRVDDSSR